MENLAGIMGKILWIDLSEKKFVEEEVPDEIFRQYLGGYGLGVYYIYKKLIPKSDPLGPDNILGFCPGLLTGTIAPFTGRFMVCGKSPLTGGWGDANCGGYFGPAVKRVGFDAIFIKGQSKDPVYIWIDNNTREILDAQDLWGKDTVTGEKLIKDRHGKSVQVALIGPAGEKLSLISGIVTDKGRIAARSGLGAVMGSKKLKAICLNGFIKIPVADNKKAGEFAKNYRDHIEKNINSTKMNSILKIIPKMASILRWTKMPMRSPESMMSKTFSVYGTSLATAISAEIGDTPIQNFKGVGYLDWPQKIARKFAHDSITQYKIKNYGCFGCPLKCGAILSIPRLGLKETHRPEYETLGAFGGAILNPDSDTALLVNDYLNRMGMDTISAGMTIAFVLECVEMKLLNQNDFKCSEFPDGFLPEWNQYYYILPFLRMIVNRENIGDLFADGTKIAAQKLSLIKGLDFTPYAMHSNGQELPMHDPRLMKSLALTYLCDPTPGRHTAGNLEMGSVGPMNTFCKGFKFTISKNPEKIGTEQVKFIKFYQSYNSLGFCEFGAFHGQYPLLELIDAICDWKISVNDLLLIGHRIQVLRHLFNIREGYSMVNLPDRILGIPPLKKGPLSGVKVDIDPMKQAYLSSLGFSIDGIPLQDTLKNLNLEFAMNDYQL